MAATFDIGKAVIFVPDGCPTFGAGTAEMHGGEAQPGLNVSHLWNEVGRRIGPAGDFYTVEPTGAPSQTTIREMPSATLGSASF